MAKTKPVASAGEHDASRGSRRHLLIVVAALAAGLFVVRKLQSSGSTSGATVPVDPTAADNSSLTSGGSGLGGVSTAGDGTPAIGQADLVNTLSPFSDQLDNLQSEIDAVAATVTTLVSPASTDPTAKPAPLSPSQFTIAQLAKIGAPGAGPSPFSDADTLALAHEFGAMTPSQLTALGVGPQPAIRPVVEHLSAAPQIVSTPAGATPVVPAPTPTASAPTPKPGKAVAV